MVVALMRRTISNAVPTIKPAGGGDDAAASRWAGEPGGDRGDGSDPGRARL